MKYFVAALFSLLLTGQVLAQQGQCGPRDQVVEFLNNQYGETRYAQGLAGPTTAMELWANEDTGTWTITFMDPSGLVCLMASGENLEWIDEPLPPQGEVN